MKGFLIKRLLAMIPVVIGVITLTFLLIHFIPGDPVDAMLGDQASFADKQILRERLGLNQTLWQQYTRFVTRLVHLDLGQSLVSQKSVAIEIRDRLPATIELGGSALLFSILIGIPLGVIAAVRKKKLTDLSISIASLFGMSMPAILLGPLLTSIFSLRLLWLPVSERGDLSHLLLPTLTLSVALIAILMRMTRSAMIDVLSEDYIRTAKAKGLSPRFIYFKHALRNALPPVLTIIGLLVGALLTGVVVVETIFDWPGLGSLLLSSILQRDYPMVQGCTLFIATVYMSVNLLTDISYALVNPKVRLE